MRKASPISRILGSAAGMSLCFTSRTFFRKQSGLLDQNRSTMMRSLNCRGEATCGSGAVVLGLLEAIQKPGSDQVKESKNIDISRRHPGPAAAARSRKAQEFPPREMLAPGNPMVAGRRIKVLARGQPGSEFRPLLSRL